MFTKPGTEIRFASALLSALGFVSAYLLFRPPLVLDHLLLLVPDDYENWLAWGMLAHSAMLIVAIVKSCRPLRHWGLILGAFCWFSLFGVFLSVWVVRFSALAALALGVIYGTIFAADVRRKPRCNPPAGR